MRAPTVTLLALSTVACGGADVPRWSPEPDLRADRAVVFVSTECSGTLVAPDAVITAAHCMEDPGPWTVRVDGRRLPVTRCAVHPLTYGEPRPCGAGRSATDVAHDLAVLRLGEPVEDVEAVPVLLSEPVLNRDWWQDLPVRIVGWDRRPRAVGLLARRSGGNRLVTARAGVFETTPSERGGFHTVIGDSGGPALVRIGGRERVLGVLRGGNRRRPEDSLFCATYYPDNARWLLAQLPSAWGRDLPPDR